jgi:hypothetical protein
MDEIEDNNEYENAKKFLMERYSYERKIDDLDTEHNAHIWAVNTILRKSVQGQGMDEDTALGAWQKVFGTSQLTHAYSRLEVAEQAAQVLARIIKSTPHSMCSDPSAWAQAERLVANLPSNRNSGTVGSEERT